MSETHPAPVGSKARLLMFSSRRHLLASIVVLGSLTGATACGLASAPREQTDQQSPVRAAKSDPNQPGDSPATIELDTSTAPADLAAKGRQCMDESHDDVCARQAFESLAARDDTLNTSVAMRLLELRRRAGDEESAAAMLQQLSERNGDGSRWLDTLATRLPGEFDMVHGLDLSALVQAPAFTRLDADAKDSVLTCDEARRAELEAKAKAKRDARRHPEADEPKDPDDEKATIYEEGTCAVMRALDSNDRTLLRGWLAGRVHNDAHRSLALLRFRDDVALDKRLAKANADGKLTPLAPGRHHIGGFTYEGGTAVVAQVGPAELLLAPEALANDFFARTQRDEASLAPDLAPLVDQAIAESFFFSAISAPALRAFKAKMGMWAAAMPEPTGLVISGITHDGFAGMFVRINTSDSTRAAMLVELTRNLLGTGMLSSGDAADPSAWLTKQVTLAQSRQGADVLAAAVLSGKQLAKLMAE